MDQTQRALQKTQELYVDGAKFTPIAMSVLEGHDSVGEVHLKPMMVGNDMLLIEITEKAGVRVPSHSHDDHESVVYLIKGRMTLTIGDQTFEAKAGDVWRHPIGVSHTSVTLEDSVAIEIKSPPRKTWNFKN